MERRFSESEKIGDLQILSIKPCFLFQHHKLNEMKDSASFIGFNNKLIFQKSQTKSISVTGLIVGTIDITLSHL